MSCARQKQCLHGKLCDYANNDDYNLLGGSCYIPHEQTNEEWLKSLNTEQLAEWIAKCIKDTIILTHGNRKYTDNIVSEKWWVEWLKQPHKE